MEPGGQCRCYRFTRAGRRSGSHGRNRTARAAGAARTDGRHRCARTDRLYRADGTDRADGGYRSPRFPGTSRADWYELARCVEQLDQLRGQRRRIFQRFELYQRSQQQHEQRAGYKSGRMECGRIGGGTGCRWGGGRHRVTGATRGTRTARADGRHRIARATGTARADRRDGGDGPDRADGGNRSPGIPGTGWTGRYELARVVEQLDQLCGQRRRILQRFQLYQRSQQ